MKQKNILILVIIIVIIVLGAVLALRKDIVAPVVFEPDETIVAEFCRRAITRAQLAKITGYDEGRFVFEDIEEEVPGIGLIGTCDIRLAGIDEEIEMVPEIGMGMGKGIGIGFFPEGIAFEAMKEKLTEFMPLGTEVKEVEGVGEKAFSVSMGGVPDLELPEGVELPERAEEFEMPIGFPEFHQIIFLDGDINQVMGVMVEDFSMEILIELAKQIETNLK